MSWSALVIGVVVAFLLLNVALAQVAVRRARALQGKPLPALPGAEGQRITHAAHALVYFFTPSCAACRTLTPRMKALAAQGSPVFAVDAIQSRELAQALSVMATPTTLEVEHGRVVNAFVGALPAAVWERYTPSA